LPEAYLKYVEGGNERRTPLIGKIAIYGWKLVNESGVQGLRGSPVKFAALVFCEKFNPSTICQSYGTGWASRIQVSEIQKFRA